MFYLDIDNIRINLATALINHAFAFTFMRLADIVRVILLSCYSCRPVWN